MVQIATKAAHDYTEAGQTTSKPQSRFLVHLLTHPALQLLCGGCLPGKPLLIYLNIDFGPNRLLDIKD